MRAVAWLVASALVTGGCGAKPVDLSSLATPIAPSPPPAPSPTPVPTYALGLYVYTVGTPCSGCRVEVTSGPNAGLATTSMQGRATLYVQDTGPVTVRVSKDKYRAATTVWTLDGRNSAGSVFLESEGPAIDLAGARVLGLRADEGCERVPVALRTRTYPVSLVSSSRGVFRAEPVDQIFKIFMVTVGVSVDEAMFSIENWNTMDNGIIEELPDGGTLQIQLWMSSVVSVENPDAISTPIAGTFMYCDASSRCTALCDETAHHLTLTRR